SINSASESLLRFHSAPMQAWWCNCTREGGSFDGRQLSARLQHHAVRFKRMRSILALLLLFTYSGLAQSVFSTSLAKTSPERLKASPPPTPATGSPDYILGPHDEVTLWSVEAEEIS